MEFAQNVGSNLERNGLTGLRCFRIHGSDDFWMGTTFAIFIYRGTIPVTND